MPASLSPHGALRDRDGGGPRRGSAVQL